ncbi:MAG: protein translocase subunit SecF [Veillonellaceae bacterium]|nr:protein translocase subunit SecF [Veillonellaceae bacterium]MCI7078841.1 protein translocase subunit SecF [Veillonellaceae bacterium]MCI7235839.1 protein translocase subunit SecF [Veillonellaceae bacterium]MDD6561990.1 protein translocase subunit SecF [Veillonellaceae bacterium]MDD7656519.1 protein translocase subunit SecF [Veillonellaceae bacterium]
MKVQQNLPKIRFDILKRSKLWFAISLLIIIPGIFCMFTKGFNFGIDFTGGTIIEMEFQQEVTLPQVRDVLREYNLDNATIQLSGDVSNVEASKDVMIRTMDLEENERKAVMASLKDEIGDYTVLREEKVGATIGGELITDALMATVISWILIILYVSYRFEWRFGIAAILTLIHDVLIVLSVFSFLQKQVDSSFVAAILTIIGYSINDTIVIFDRIRENQRLHFKRGGDLNELANRSIYQTLTRSLYTVFTVLFTTFALYFFGGDTTKDFSFALLIGFFSGSYSSIFIASPLWVVLKNRFPAKKI